MTSVAIIFAASSGRMLAILENKNLPRPRKDGKGMCKGKASPWDFPGGKRELGDADERAVMVRELREETGLDADGLQSVREGRFYVPDAKCTVFLFEVTQEFDVQPGQGVKETAWVDREHVNTLGTYRMQRALAVSSGFVTCPEVAGDDDPFAVFETAK